MKNKIVKILVVFFIGSIFLLTGQNSEAKKKKPTSARFVGALKCDGSCHDPWYLAWSETPHAKTYNLLKPGERADAKKKAGLDPKKDYTGDPNCLPCHVTGYKKPGGFKGPDSKKPTEEDDEDEPNLSAVACEMCHSVTGGALFRVLMKDSKGKFKRTEMEALGYRADLENVCKRCHEHPNTPFKPSLDPKYKFNYEERKKKVHNAEKYYNEDNKDQIITRDKNGVSVHAPGYTDTHPLPIEKWEVVDGKFKKIVWPFWSKKKKKIVWKGLKKVGKVAKKKIETRSSDGRYIDNGDGTITDTKSGLMWTKKDSYADLGKCLDWNDSTDYVSKLGTGGFKDWRMPSVSELKTIYEESKSSNLSYDHNPKVLLHLDSIFADGAAYWYWSSEAARKCCAVEFHFNSGKIDDDARKSCNDRGVRAVRLGR